MPLEPRSSSRSTCALLESSRRRAIDPVTGCCRVDAHDGAAAGAACGANVGEWFGEHETTGRQRAPFFDASLQCADLTGGEGTGAFLTKSPEEFLGRPIGFGLEPGHHSRPRGLKWI